mmetsp:Transcript_15438/g.39051  ORF Transcript_15438/g.39051 Transcript_15438/m.39051 type:complete len:232 (-) Transcript_15438:1045-1740(-)
MAGRSDGSKSWSADKLPPARSSLFPALVILVLRSITKHWRRRASSAAISFSSSLDITAVSARAAFPTFPLSSPLNSALPIVCTQPPRTSASFPSSSTLIFRRATAACDRTLVVTAVFAAPSILIRFGVTSLRRRIGMEFLFTERLRRAPAAASRSPSELSSSASSNATINPSLFLPTFFASSQHLCTISSHISAFPHRLAMIPAECLRSFSDLLFLASPLRRASTKVDHTT